MPKNRSFALVLVFVLALALAGCNGQSSSTGASTGTGGSTANTGNSGTSGSTPNTDPAMGSLPQADQQEVPDVTGLGMTTARMMLGAAHLTFDIETEPAGADLPADNTVVIVKQTPAAGTKVDSGSAVTVVIKKKD